jgi:heme/copper-type cytochrome/quinol oxidase subunit 2
MNELLWTAAPIAVLVGMAALAWMLMRRIAELRRRLALEETQSRLLSRRLDDVLVLYETRLLRLEGVKGAAGSRSRQRRRAAELLRLGDDPAAAAKRCELPAAELQVLLEIEELRSRQAMRPLN